MPSDFLVAGRFVGMVQSQRRTQSGTGETDRFVLWASELSGSQTKTASMTKGRFKVQERPAMEKAEASLFKQSRKVKTIRRDVMDEPNGSVESFTPQTRILKPL